MHTRRKLMASFVVKSKVKTFLSYLNDNKVTDKAFVLSNNKHTNVLLVTYDIRSDINMSNLKEFGVLNTLAIQRNTDTNTLYSINALNYLLEDESMKTEQEKTTIKLDWSNYSNCLITTSDKKINVINTKLLKMVKFVPNFDINKVNI